MQKNIEREIAAQNVFAQIILGVTFVDGCLQPVPTERIFVSQIQVGGRCPSGEAGDDNPFDDLVWVIFHQNAVVERARLAFIRIDAHVDRAGMVLRQERPLQSGGKPAPPRPRSPLALTISVVCSGDISLNTLRRP